MDILAQAKTIFICSFLKCAGIIKEVFYCSASQNDSDFMLLLQSYQGLIIDSSLVY